MRLCQFSDPRGCSVSSPQREGPGGDFGRDGHHRLPQFGIEACEKGSPGKTERRSADRRGSTATCIAAPRRSARFSTISAGFSLAVDHALIQPGIDLAEAERRGKLAPSVLNISTRWRLVGVRNLGARPGRRHHDGPHTVGDLAEAVVPHRAQQPCPGAPRSLRPASRPPGWRPKRPARRPAVLEQIGEIEDGGAGVDSARWPTRKAMPDAYRDRGPGGRPSSSRACST